MTADTLPFDALTGADLVVMVDLATGTVLGHRSARRVSQERCDAVGRWAAAVLGAAAPLAVVASDTALRIAVRRRGPGAVPTSEALVLLLHPAAEVAATLAALGPEWQP
jgi:hypothetical protein